MKIPLDISLERSCSRAGDGCGPDRLAHSMAALGHPARIAILRHLSGVQACCCKEVVAQFDLAQSTVSQHLKVLHEAGLVCRTSQGQKSCYAVDRNALRELSGGFHDLIDMCVAGESESQG